MKVSIFAGTSHGPTRDMLTADDILRHYAATLQWGESLAHIDPAQWNAPLHPGGWSVGECVAHLTAWDDFMVCERMPRIHDGAQLGDAPDSTSFNNDAADHARSEASQQQVAAEFMAVRTELMDHIRLLFAEQGDPTFSINGTTMTLTSYLAGHIDHDIHHRGQIAAVLDATNG